MKKLFSVIAALMFFCGAVVFAFNVQDEPICSELTHLGYSYTGPNETPQLPLNPLETGLSPLGNFGTDFVCDQNPEETCHWVYMQPDQDNPDGAWVKCSGDFQEIEN